MTLLEQARRDFASRFPDRAELATKALEVMAHTWLDGYLHGAGYAATRLQEVARDLVLECQELDAHQARRVVSTKDWGTV